MPPQSLRHLPEVPTDRQTRRLWGECGWRCLDAYAVAGIRNPPAGWPSGWPASDMMAALVAAADAVTVGSWTPTDTQGAGRVLVQECSSGEWVALLDGTPCRLDGAPMTWPDRYIAGYDALRMVGIGFHGPLLRFHPARPWVEHEGFTMRLSADDHAGNHAVNHVGGIAVLVRSPARSVRSAIATSAGSAAGEAKYEEGWSVILGSDFARRLQALDNRVCFDTAEKARAVADDEVARWVTGRRVAGRRLLH